VLAWMPSFRLARPDKLGGRGIFQDDDGDDDDDPELKFESRSRSGCIWNCWVLSLSSTMVSKLRLFLPKSSSSMSVSRI
jgi:hypothetical protein